MNVLNYLLNQLKGAVTNVQTKNAAMSVPSTIILLDGTTAVKPKSLCIGSRKDIFHTIKQFSIPKDAIFFTPVTKEAQQYTLAGLNLIETNLELAPLYNRLNTALTALGKEAGRQDMIFDFDLFFKSILSMDLLGEAEVKAAMRQLDYSSEDPYNMIVIEAQNPATFQSTLSKARQALAEILPSSNVTFLGNRLILMYHSKDRLVGFPEKIRKELGAFLKEFDAFAGISNQTRNFEMIRTEYIIASNILNIAKRMRQDPDERIFLQEEYGVYYILHLCYKQFEQTFHHNNILYLTHPGLSALIRYDLKHNTNLREVLLCYLLNDRSLTKTAKLLFMHRNTTMNKINKITEIIEDDLEDSYIRQRLLFSCMLYDYCERYCYKPFPIAAFGEEQ